MLLIEKLSKLERGFRIDRAAFRVRVNLQGVLQVIDALLFVVRQHAFEQSFKSLLRSFRRALNQLIAREGECLVTRVEDVEGEPPLHSLQLKDGIAEVEDARSPTSIRHQLAHQAPFVDLNDARRAQKRRARFILPLRDAVCAEHDHRRIGGARETDSCGERRDGCQRQPQALIGNFAFIV